MPNIIIQPWHQSSPDFKYDPVLAREAAAARDPAALGERDWDREDWEQLDPISRRRRMKNNNYDAEFESPGHNDPNLELLQQRAYIERVTRRPEEWVEESLELYELNCHKAKAQHYPGQERWQGSEVEEQRLVNILHPSQVMRKLRAAGVDARDEIHRNARIWLNDWTALGMVGVNAWVKPVEMDKEGYLLLLREAKSQEQSDLITENWKACLEGRKVIKTYTSLQEPCGPEWSIMRFDDHGVATKEKYRGWRTAMLVLICAELLTEEEVDRAFGPPAGEPASWYRAQLQAYRQLRLGRAL